MATTFVRGIALTLLTLWVSVVAIGTSSAQSTWTCEYDLTGSDGGFSAFAGTYVEGVGFQVATFGGQPRLILQKEIGVQYTYAAIRTNVAVVGVNAQTRFLDSGFSLEQIATTSDYLFFEATITYEATSIGIDVGNNVGGVYQYQDPTLAIEYVELRGAGDSPCSGVELTRPLGPNERVAAFQGYFVQDGLGLEPEKLNNYGSLFAASAQQRVSAVASGTVSYRRFLLNPVLGENDCFELIGTPESYLSNRCPFTYVLDVLGQRQFFALGESAAPIWIVTITGQDGRVYTQLVSDADQYLTEGQTVDAGCWVGRTVALQTPIAEQLASWLLNTIIPRFTTIEGLFDIVDPNSTASISNYTAVWASEGGEYVDVWDEYASDPSAAAPCNTSESFSGCVGDSRLADYSQWQSSNGVSWQEPGAILQPNDYIRATYNMIQAREPEMVVRAFPFGVLPMTAFLQLGQTQQPTTIAAAAELDQLVIEGGPHVPDVGDFYSVIVRNTNSYAIRIDYVCVRHTLDEEGGEEPPPTEPPPGETGPGETPPLIEESCQAITTPTGNDVGEWAVWSWQKLNSYFTCELRVLLNTIIRAITQFFRTFGWVVRYNMASMQAGLNWMSSDVFPWLAGYLSNIAQGQTTTVYTSEGGEQCNNLFCAITGLGDGLFGFFNNIITSITGLAQTLLDGLIPMLQQIVDAILQLAGQAIGVLLDEVIALLNVLITLIGMVIDLFNLARNILYAILVAYTNATPQLPDGVPNCTADPGAAPLCSIIWIMDNTIFSGVGYLFIPLLIGMWSIHLLLWAITTIRGAVLDAGRMT